MEQIQGRWWARLDDGRIECRLCPRLCRLKAGQRGFCYVREATDDGMVLTTYGRSSGFCIDPIEKKPLNHFLPGSRVLSFGTVGCNLGCQFCQNWDISKARADDRLQATADPSDIALAAFAYGCESVAYTYNDPVVFAEYVIDTAAVCREHGLRNVAVTNGYITAEARPDLYGAMDAANVDLKGFTEDFYRKRCLGHLQPVLETLEWLVKESSVWLEVTTLLIPGENDSDAEIERLVAWFAEHLGVDVPLHFTAFYPAFRMVDLPRTPPETLSRARDLAFAAGLRFVYTGNVADPVGASTWCPLCKGLLVERIGYRIGRWGLDAEGRCARCQTKIPGVFEARPGMGSGRPEPVTIGQAQKMTA